LVGLATVLASASIYYPKRRAVRAMRVVEVVYRRLPRAPQWGGAYFTFLKLCVVINIIFYLLNQVTVTMQDLNHMEVRTFVQFKSGKLNTTYCICL